MAVLVDRQPRTPRQAPHRFRKRHPLRPLDETDHIATGPAAEAVKEPGIAAQLKEIRKRRGLSQVELARRLGLHRSLISQYECGYLRLHGALLLRLAQALETTPDEILTATPVAAATEPPIDRRFLRRLKHVDKLSPHQKRILLATIDAFLAKVS